MKTEELLIKFEETITNRKIIGYIERKDDIFVVTENPRFKELGIPDCYHYFIKRDGTIVPTNPMLADISDEEFNKLIKV